MKVSVSAIGRFHSVNQARQLHERSMLAALFSGYPNFKLNQSSIPKSMIRSYPWLHSPYMVLARSKVFQRTLGDDWAWRARRAHDQFVARNLPDSDILIALSSMGLTSGTVMQSRGGRYVCDRGSSHILSQNSILSDEYEMHGMRWKGIDARVLEMEQLEYNAADMITVPSNFARETFLAQGVNADKLRVIRYGSDISKFRPSVPKAPNLRVLFVGQLNLRKGLHYLLDAFRLASIPKAELILIGQEQEESSWLLQRARGLHVELLGLQHNESLVREMGRASVLVLPSVEEGFGMVVTEAMACGTPIITTVNTGAADVVSDGVEGFVVPVRDVEAISASLVALATDSDLARNMGEAARKRAESWGGWQEYGDDLSEALTGLLPS